MTTKEISQQIVSSLIAEIPIEYRDAKDLMEIEKEMVTIVHERILYYRQQMYDGITKEVARQLRITESEYWLRHSISEDILNKVKEAILNVNKE